MLDDHVSDLIREIYRGGTDASAWTGALDRLLTLTGSRFVMVSSVDTLDRAGMSSHFYGADDARFLDAVDDYQSHFYQDDPMLNFAIRQPLAGSACLPSLVEAETAAAADRRYLDWSRSEMGVSDSRVHYTPQIDGLMLGVSLHTSRDRGYHSPRECALFALLFGHIDNALRLVARPPLVDGPDAIVLVDRLGRVRDVSDAAAALFAQRDGLTVVRRRLQAARRADQARLDALLVAAGAMMERGGAAASIAITRPSGARPLLVTVRPLPPAEGLAHALGVVAAIRIVDPERHLPADPSWTMMFGLTPAESRLAEALLNGDQSLRAAAAAIGIAYGTARTQLASIFDKTGVRTQSHLLRLLTSIARG